MPVYHVGKLNDLAKSGVKDCGLNTAQDGWVDVLMKRRCAGELVEENGSPCPGSDAHTNRERETSRNEGEVQPKQPSNRMSPVKLDEHPG